MSTLRLARLALLSSADATFPLLRYTRAEVLRGRGLAVDEDSTRFALWLLWLAQGGAA